MYKLLKVIYTFSLKRSDEQVFLSTLIYSSVILELIFMNLYVVSNYIFKIKFDDNRNFYVIICSMVIIFLLLKLFVSEEKIKMTNIKRGMLDRIVSNFIFGFILLLSFTIVLGIVLKI